MATAENRASTCILLAFDGSRHSEAALAWYAKLGLQQQQQQHQRLVIFYSAEAPPLPRGNTTLKMSKTEIYASVMRDSMAEIDAIRQRCLALCQQLGIRTVDFVDKYEADPGKAIVAMAKDVNASTIVMGTRGLNRLKRSLLGSVSDYVVHHAHRPVIVVPRADCDGEDKN